MCVRSRVAGTRLGAQQTSTPPKEQKSGTAPSTQRVKVTAALQPRLEAMHSLSPLQVGPVGRARSHGRRENSQKHVSQRCAESLGHTRDRAVLRRRRDVISRAFTRDTEALWMAFHLTPEEKEKVWFAAYDAPYHGQASSPYRYAR